MLNSNAGQAIWYSMDLIIEEINSLCDKSGSCKDVLGQESTCWTMCKGEKSKAEAPDETFMQGGTHQAEENTWSAELP